MKDVYELKTAIETMHHCRCRHSASVDVTEWFEGQIAWQGTVEMFKLKGHPRAKRCYAWSYQDDNGETQYVTILHIPPVDSPQMAVKAAIASQGP